MLFEHFNDIPLNGWPYTYFKPNEVACRGTGKILMIRKVATDVGFKGFGMHYRTFIHIDMGRRRQW